MKVFPRPATLSYEMRGMEVSNVNAVNKKAFFGATIQLSTKDEKTLQYLEQNYKPRITNHGDNVYWLQFTLSLNKMVEEFPMEFEGFKIAFPAYIQKHVMHRLKGED